METIDFLPTVKAYPALSRTYGEVSCIAGIKYSPDQQLGPGDLSWIRLYPVPFRDLDDAQKFAKYQPLRVTVESHTGDRRPETRRPTRESIELVGEKIPSDSNWRARRRFIEPLLEEPGSMCGIQEAQKRDGTSLGIFRPAEIKGLEIKPVDLDKEKEEFAQALAAQGSLLGAASPEEQQNQKRALEQIPWQFKLKYRCSHSECKGNHRQSIVDWEIARYFIRVRNSPQWEEKMREQILEKVCGPDRDLALIVGNQHQHLNAFLILGFWWPQKAPEQLSLG